MRDALTVLPRFADDIEVTVIDDGSTDRTGKIADDLAKADPRVRVVHHGARRGYGGAVRCDARILVSDTVLDRSAISAESEDDENIAVFKEFIQTLPDDPPGPSTS